RRDGAGARALSRPDHLGCAHPLGRRRRVASVPAEDAERQAVALRTRPRALRLLRPLRRARDRALRRRAVRTRPGPRAGAVPRVALLSRCAERRRAERLQRDRAGGRAAGQSAGADSRSCRVLLALSSRQSRSPFARRKPTDSKGVAGSPRSVQAASAVVAPNDSAISRKVAPTRRRNRAAAARKSAKKRRSGRPRLATPDSPGIGKAK